MEIRVSWHPFLQFPSGDIGGWLVVLRGVDFRECFQGLCFRLFRILTCLRVSASIELVLGLLEEFLRCGKVVTGEFCSTRIPGNGDCLPGIAHFLDRSAGAGCEPDQ